MKILFACVHNSARSQMAEALMKQIAGDRLEVESAGLVPGKLNPLAVRAMQELDIDIANNKTQSVFDMIEQGRKFDIVITVCAESQSERCPIFPGQDRKLHWSFEDPSSFTGSEEDKLRNTIRVCEQIKKRIVDFIEST